MHINVQIDRLVLTNIAATPAAAARLQAEIARALQAELAGLDGQTIPAGPRASIQLTMAPETMANYGRLSQRIARQVSARLNAPPPQGGAHE